MSSPGRPELHKIVAFCLVSSMCLTRGIYLVYLARVGLSFTEVAVYQATFSASTAILEVPTGLAGDWLGKRRALCLGSLLLASHALMMLAVPVVPYVAAAVVEATAYVFISGSDRALLYEAMQGSGSEGRYLQVSSRLMAAESLVSGASIAAGSLLTEISWSLPFVLSAAACVAQLVIAASIQQHDPLALERVGGGEGWTLASRLRGALAPIASSAGFVIVMFGLLDGVYGGFYSLNQLLFDGLGIATPAIGGFFSASYLVNSVSYLAAERLAAKVGRGRLLRVLVTLELALLALALCLHRHPLPFVAAAFVACALPEMIYVLAESDVQERAPAEYRSTSLSLMSLMNSLASSLLFVGAGLLLDGAGAGATLALVVACAAGVTGAYLFSIRRSYHVMGDIR